MSRNEQTEKQNQNTNKDESNKKEKEHDINSRKSHGGSSKRKHDDDRRRRNHHRKHDDSRERSKSNSRKRKDLRKHKSSKSSRNKRKRRSYSSSSESSSSSSDSSSYSSSSSSNESTSSNSSSPKGKDSKQNVKRKVANQKLLQKLAARGETLEEREERRAQRRAARIEAQFGYTAQDNPFNDPNLADTFVWKKKEETNTTATSTTQPGGDQDENKTKSRKAKQDKTFSEIEKVRQRRRDYEQHREEMERIRAEEARMKELEHYDDWAKKEEEFHLQQQRQRSAIRLVEGREKPIDVLAKNLLLFGLTEAEKQNRAAVKYKENYNALEELETLEVELEEPHVFLKDLKLSELEELLIDIQAFRTLEREAIGNITSMTYQNDGHDDMVLRYWDALFLVTKAEIDTIKSSNKTTQDNQLTNEIQKMFVGQSTAALEEMKKEIETKIKKCHNSGNRPVFDDGDGGVVDVIYWQRVLDDLVIHLAKNELSDIHSKMLVCQLEKLEKKKEELGKDSESARNNIETDDSQLIDNKKGTTVDTEAVKLPQGIVDPNFGNLEEELGLTSEVDLGGQQFIWQERFRPRKPRYFNRIKSGYDWNKYNQTHYDHDNPPPKTVQGYKFNIFYPDLIDKSSTPQYKLEPTDSNEFCIIRFHAGPPYEDIAFKILNRQWNMSRKRGFKCTFERGVLSLYFNFASHWYRR